VKVAVIDVGYNSLKMVKYLVEPDGTQRAYGQFGVMARLGEGLEQMGYLGKEPMSGTVEALKLCKESAALDEIKHILLIGTSPVREAINREEFLRTVQEETGMKMRVLTGNEEALYGFLGAARSVDAPTMLLFDLGGGSLELTYAVKQRIVRILSLPLGVLKLTDQYAGKDGTFSKKNRARMTKRINQLLPSRKELGLDKDVVLVGTGGTARAMARFHQDSIDYPLNKVHNYVVSVDSVQRMSRQFFKMNMKELGKAEAIGAERSQTITAGALVVRLLMERLDLSALTVSTDGLRDGILSEFLARGGNAVPEAIQKEEIERILQRPRFATRTGSNYELAECLVRNGILDEKQETLLLVGLERGREPDCAQANPDSLFGIIMGEDLPMSHEEQVLMSISLVRARRSRTANWFLRKYGRLLGHEDVKAVKKMGSCLRLMEILDRAGATFKVSYSGGLRINVIGSENPFPLELAKTAALTFSGSIKRNVLVVVSVKEGRRREETARARV
jgi:exopolyphosphatase / guanosine-5'-triphosphate,3'-diphosphate pyrophosphatase